MNKDNLPGLSPLWLISLAMTLGILLILVVPLIITKEAIHPSDWIGFAGNIVAGAVALIAAIIAWRSVQAQISVQSRIAEIQSAIQRMELLQRNFAILQREIRLSKDLQALATNVLIPSNHILSEPNITPLMVASAKDFYDEISRKLSATEAELDLAMVDVWAFKTGLTRRGAMVSGIFEMQKKIVEAILPLQFALVAHPGEGNYDALTNEEAAACRSVDVKPVAETLGQSATSYQAIAFEEVRRLHIAINKTRLEAGL
jgi:hypothetical protein